MNEKEIKRKLKNLNEKEMIDEIVRFQKSGKTNRDIFPKDEKKSIKTQGRPQVSRDLVKRLLQEERYNYKQIADHLKCSTRTVRRIRDELVADGEITPKESEKGPGIIAADFDDETERATGMRFSEWLKGKRKDWNVVFSFCRKTWEHVWDKPSLVMLADRDEREFANQICMKFINTFGADKKRIRDRKKLIRRLFTFLSRGDLNDLFFTMDSSQDEISIRELPEIEMINFPLRMEKALIECERRYGSEFRTMLEFKMISGLRTGLRKDERGLAGIKIGSKSDSYILFEGPDECKCKVKEKRNIKWDIFWIPKKVRHNLYKISKERSEGDFLLNMGMDSFRDKWYAASEEILGFRLHLHDIRKIFATWIIIMKIPMDIAKRFNAGWKDLNTLDTHYNQIRTNLMKKSQREAYRNNIPDWFKEGIADYAEEI